MVCVTCGLVALVLWPGGAYAWKPVDHIYAANQAIAPILAGRDVVTLLGKDYAVPAAVATSIRNYPGDYRGGVVGPDAFPDIVGGQGNVHPDTRADNGKTQADWTPGHSYAYEWLALVYRAGWSDYNKCSGCAEGQRDLAFSYGYLTHAGEDMWGHTFVNGFAEGVFPSVSDLDKNGELKIALRHVVTEGYVGLHTPVIPANDSTIDAPTGFVYNTFIASPMAAVLGRGVVIDGFFKIRATLAAKAASLTDYIDSGTFKGCGWPWNWPACAQRGYVNEWIGDIDSGLRAYPELSLTIARDLFGQRKADIPALENHVKAYVNAHVLSMLGAPKIVGQLLGWFTAVKEWINQFVEPIIKPIKDLERQFLNKMVELATGATYDEWKKYFTSPATYINDTNLGFQAATRTQPSTSTQLNQLMGLSPDAKPDEPCTATSGPSCFDPSKFAAMKDTITMARLILLNGAGLTSLLTAQNAAPYYLSDIKDFPQNVTVQVSPAGDMTGWIKSLDGDHQWLAKSPDGRSFGTGRMYLWKSCNARPVFRALFTDWEHGTNNFPDSADPYACVQTVTTAPLANVTQPTITPFGAPRRCVRGPICGPGQLFLSEGAWTGGALSYSYKWFRLPGPGCPGLQACDVPSSQVYTLTKADSDASLVGEVTASNEYGETAKVNTVVYKVPKLDLTAPVISNLRAPPRGFLDVLVTLSKPAALTVTLARLTGKVPCGELRRGAGECENWPLLEPPGIPGGRLPASGLVGVNKVSLARFGALIPGSYVVTVVPEDAFGNIGRAESAQFKIF